MLRPDHARTRTRRTVTFVVAAAVGLATGAGVAVAERSEGSGTQTADGAGASITPTVDAVPAVTAPAVALPMSSVLPVSDETAIVVEATGIPQSTWSTEAAVSPWVMVNKANPLDPEDYVPEELVHPYGVSGGSSELLRAEAAEALVAMRSAAVDAGLDFVLASAYRSYSTQRTLFATYSAKWGTAKADTFSARAGHSEHQTGWAVDVAWSSACRERACFADEPIGQWIDAHAWEHGWIVRYPEGETEITGYRYEPWHLRYVGLELSTWMHDNGVTTLEEALGYPAAPEYTD